MRTHPVRVRDESKDLYDYLLEGIEAASKFQFPPRMTSPYSKAKCFKKENPEYHQVPNSILRGYYKFGKPKSDGMMGLRIKYSRLHIWGLGDIKFEAKAGLNPIIGKVVQVELDEDYMLTFYGLGLRGRGAPIQLRNYSHLPLHELEQIDPIFRYLKVNQVFTEYGFSKMCRIRDVIAYLQENPHLTRRQMERMGIRGDKMWDIIVNYEPSLDSWIRAGSKPKEGEYQRGHYILSNGQHKKRIDREWSLSDHLSPSDIEAGKLKNQSFDSQTYEAIRSDKEPFFQ